MILRKRESGSGKVALDLTPMIDVALQLLLICLLTVQVRAEEGEFEIQMPPRRVCPEDTICCMGPIGVRLTANDDGSLAQLQLGRRKLGNDDRAFAALNREILNIIDRPGNPLTKDMEVEIDADFELRYEYVVKTITACTGRIDADSNRIVRYIHHVQFAQPRTPKGG